MPQIVIWPEVDTGFHAEHVDTPLPRGKRRKLKAMGLSFDGATHDYLRQVAWINKNGHVDDELWRPPDVKRGASKAWLQRTDRQVWHGTCYAGWRGVQFSDAAIWRDPYSWPSVTLSIDLGSDGLCASNGLLYQWDVNLWRFPTSHT